MDPEDTILDGALAAIQGFAADYTPAVVVILGVTVVIGLGIWGFIKLTGLFRRTAK